jgi:DnaJ-class molecular chaperone
MRLRVVPAKDYYGILGLRKGASKKEIQEAYRRLALLFHPDRNKDGNAEERFKEISEAYAVLSGKEKEPARYAAQNPKHGTGSRGPDAESGIDGAWAADVLRRWQQMEREHNNMYR